MRTHKLLDLLGHMAFSQGLPRELSADVRGPCGVCRGGEIRLHVEMEEMRV